MAKLHITDIFQEITNKGENVYAFLIQKNWKEFDTAQDYLKVNSGNKRIKYWRQLK